MRRVLYVLYGTSNIQWSTMSFHDTSIDLGGQKSWVQSYRLTPRSQSLTDNNKYGISEGQTMSPWVITIIYNSEEEEHASSLLGSLNGFTNK